MGNKSLHSPQHISTLGSPKDKVICHSQKQEVLAVLLQGQRGSSLSQRRLSFTMEHRSLVCLSTNSSNIHGPAQDLKKKKIESHSYPHSSHDATSDMVYIPYSTGDLFLSLFLASSLRMLARSINPICRFSGSRHGSSMVQRLGNDPLQGLKGGAVA